MRRVADPISAASLLYLALPSFMFVGGWLRPVAAILLGALIVIALVQQGRQFPAPSTRPEGPAIAFLIMVAACWSAFGGAGHLFYSNVDWHTRDAVYADLFLSAWPPSYGMRDGAPLLLRTAMGYFLPPASLVDFLGASWAPRLLLAWSILGTALFLLLLPLPVRLGPRLVALSLVVVFFSGMDFAGILLVHGHVPIHPLPLEWWLPWTYSSLTAQLFWAPNHALPLWIATALFYRHRKSPILPSLGVFLAPLLLLWTPFAVIGLLPWFLRSTWQSGKPLLQLARTIPAPVWAMAVPLAAIIAVLLASPGVSGNYSNASMAGTARPGTDMFDPGLALHFVQFLAFEFFLLAIAIVHAERKAPEDLAFAVVILALLPMVTFGPSNDWILRVSTPSLIILMIVAIQVLDKTFSKELALARAMPMVAVLALGAITPWFEFMRAATWPRTPPNYSINLVEQQQGGYPPHYIGRFYRPELGWLFKNPSLVPGAGERRTYPGISPQP